MSDVVSRPTPSGPVTTFNHGRSDLFKDPLGFMNDNIIVVGFEGDDHDTLDGKIFRLRLAKKSPTGGKASQMGRDLGLYAIGPDSVITLMNGLESKSHTFKAYFCPYRQGKTLGTIVGSDADFMFTTQMDGCTLGIGDRQPDGTHLIYHANVGGDVGAQQTALTNAFNAQGQTVGTVWDPPKYRFEMGQAELCSTTFGVRDTATNRWTFYAQTYQRANTIPDKFYLRDVKKVT